MTAKQKAFCEEYVKTYNGTQAYLLAFDTKEPTTAVVNAHKLLKQPDVIEYIKELQAENVRRFGDLAEVIAKELAEDILYRDTDGKHSSNWQKSVDLLQKQLGLQNQKLDVSTSNGIEINIVED